MDSTVPVNDFTYGLVTPLAAFAMACLGSALGLRCVVRAVSLEPSRRAAWLVLGAASIGTGIWTMHFIAMMGFTAANLKIRYDLPVTLASLAVAVVVVALGVFAVGLRGRGAPTLLTAGCATGAGVAAMHYLGMAGMRFNGHLEYSLPTVGLSVLIAVAASTVALWCAVSVKGLLAALASSLIMGVAVSGMHYTGMAALSVRAHDAHYVASGEAPFEILAPVLIGPVIFLMVTGLIVALDPPNLQPKLHRTAGSGR